MVQPESSFSRLSVTLVLMLSGVRLAPPSCAESAMEKQAAWAAAISSSGFVPGAFSKRVVKEYGVLESTPPGAEMLPLPSFNPPFHTALAFLCMGVPHEWIWIGCRPVIVDVDGFGVRCERRKRAILR